MKKKNQIRNEVVVSSNKLSFFYFLLCNVRIVRWIRSNICCRLRSVFEFCRKKTQWNIFFEYIAGEKHLAETVKIVITFTLRIILISRLICTKAISFAGTLALRAQSECVEPWSSGIGCWRERVCCCLAGNRYMVIISKLLKLRNIFSNTRRLNWEKCQLPDSESPSSATLIISYCLSVGEL